MSISLFSQTGKISAWKQMESWHAKQKQYTAEFENQNTALMSAIGGSFTSFSDGLMEITMNKAVAAAQQRVAARMAVAEGNVRGIDLSI